MTDFNTQPQPRTFAPSKEDVLQNLQYFFGAPVSPEKLKDYSEHHAVTHHFPGLNSNHSQSNHSHVHLFFAMALIAPLLCARRRVHWPEHQCAQLLNSLFCKRASRIAHCSSPCAPLSQRSATRSTISSSTRRRRGRRVSDCPTFRFRALSSSGTSESRSLHTTTDLAHHRPCSPPTLLTTSTLVFAQGPLRCAPDAACAVRGHVAHADVAAQVPTANALRRVHTCTPEHTRTRTPEHLQDGQ